MSESESLCLSCGLCCNGTLIGFVQLSTEEIPPLKGSMDIIENPSGGGVFLHPCSNFCDGCTIYSKRPTQCASFKCKLLTSVEQKELDFNEASESIAEVKERKIILQKRLETLDLQLDSESFYFQMVELKKVLQKKEIDGSFTQSHQDLTANLEQFDALLSKRFGVTMD